MESPVTFTESQHGHSTTLIPKEAQDHDSALLFQDYSISEVSEFAPIGFNGRVLGPQLSHFLRGHLANQIEEGACGRQALGSHHGVIRFRVEGHIHNYSSHPFGVQGMKLRLSKQRWVGKADLPATRQRLND